MKNKDKKIVKSPVGEFVTEAMKEYGKEVVEQRALPDYRDGFKPVQRRIMWAMYKMGMFPNRHFNKAARVVGEVIGKYHPHGDQAAFGSMVTMANARYPLIDGEGNWGTATDPPAAMRYIEARISKLGMKVFDCVPIAQLVPNYDAHLEEPVIIPSRLPVILLNGTEGIAVGVASKIPSHNLKEIINAFRYLIKEKNPTIKGVMRFVKGPDFVYGGVLISSKKEVRNVYRDGEGSLSFRCKYHFEKQDGLQILVVDSYAPGFNPTSFLTKCKADFVDEGLVEYARNETNGEDGIRLCVGFKNSLIITEQVLPRLETKVAYRFNVTERNATDAKFKFFGFMEMLESWLDYLRETETKWIEYQIEQLLIKLWKAEAILTAIKNLDVYFKILKTSKDLVADIEKKLKLTEDQANYLLDTSSRRLAHLNLKEQQAEVDDLHTQIKVLKKKLKNIDGVVLATLDEFKPFFDERRTLIREDVKGLKVDDIYVVGNEKGLLDITFDFDFNGGRKKWNFAVSAKDGFVMITKNGLGIDWDHRHIEKGQLTYPDVIGLVSKSAEILVVGDDKGKGLCIEIPKVNEYVIMKTEGELVSAVGIKRGETLVVANDTVNKVVTFDFKDLPVTRRNSKGWNMLPQGRRPLYFDVLCKNCEIVDSRGKKISLKDYLKDPINNWIIGSKNVVMVGTKWHLLDKEETIEFLRKRTADNIMRMK